jgi:hypothetical protein
MPPKQAAVKLNSVAPSADELAAARKVLAGVDKKQLRSKFACMAHWLKDNPDAAASSSRGDQRKAYLEQFMVWQMRQKNLQKESQSRSTVEVVNTTYNNLRWWSREKMDTELGAKKAAAWRESCKLQTRPDPVTGSDDPDYVEYGCPEDWSSLATGDTESHDVITRGDADESDLTMLNGIRGGMPSEDVVVKAEQKTEEDMLQEKATALMQNPRPMLRRLQDYELECKLLATKATDGKYTGELGSDVTKFLSKLTKAIKLLNKMCTTQSVQEGEVPQVVTMTDALIKEHDDIMQWAQTFGLVEKPKKRRKA